MAGHPPEAADLANVEGAVRLARNSFAHRQVIASNSESNYEESQFKWPDKVLNAPEWLATTYFDSRSGQLTVKDLDASCHEHYHMWYKSSQGETTMIAFPNSYNAVVDGDQNGWRNTSAKETALIRAGLSVLPSIGTKAGSR